MSGDGCACKDGRQGEAVPMVPDPPSRTPCGAGSDRSVLVWDPLALAPSALQVSGALPLGGANALEFSAVVIGAGGAIQTLLQAQVSNDALNWTNAGSSVQLLAIGNAAAPLITGLGARYFRIAAQNQTANAVVFIVAARLSGA